MYIFTNIRVQIWNSWSEHQVFQLSYRILVLWQGSNQAKTGQAYKNASCEEIERKQPEYYCVVADILGKGNVVVCSPSAFHIKKNSWKAAAIL